MGVAANARHFAPGCRPWLGFKSDNFVLCRADGAMEQRCYRFRHTRKIAIRQPSGSARRTGQTCIMAFVNLTYYNSAAYYAPLLLPQQCSPRSAAPRLWRATLGVKLFYFSSTSVENLTDPSFKISTWGAVPGLGLLLVISRSASQPGSRGAAGIPRRRWDGAWLNARAQG